MRIAPNLALVVVAGLFASCTKKEEPARGGDVPPPPPSALVAKAGACQNPGAVDDAVSAGFFPKSIASPNFCVDTAPGSTKAYGAQAKLTMDAVCTTAFDGECEVYKRYGLKRVVTLRYVDGSGKGGVVEVVLSQFDSEAGAYGMFTKRVVADADPASPEAQKAVPTVGAAAIGGGRASSWRGAHLVELVYMNEQEAPAAMVKSSEAILPPLLKAINEKLPGSPEKPAPAKNLPEANLLPLGVSFAPKETFGIKGPSATGFYKDGEKRYRFVAIAPADEAAAKEGMKALRGTGGALPVADVGDEALHVVMQEGKGSPKIEWLFGRKGARILGVGDEEFAINAGEPLDAQKAVRLVKDEKVARLKAQLK